MDQENFKTFAAKKAFEISYALFRLSARIKKENFAAYVESHATGLLSSAAMEDYGATKKALMATDYFMKLGAEAGIISYENSQILTRETSGFYAAIVDFENSAKAPETDLGGIFQEKHARKIKQSKQEWKEKKKEKIESDVDSSENELEIGSGKTSEESGNQAISGEYSGKTRQSAILDIIRQNNISRLKDIIRDIHEFFPDVSERTVRYDLQRLVEEGIVERTGNGGPATFYQAKGGPAADYIGRKTELGEVEVGEI